MGFTVGMGKRYRKHCDTREEVEEDLKTLNKGRMPALFYVSRSGVEHYSDDFNSDIIVTPDPALSKEE